MQTVLRSVFVLVLGFVAGSIVMLLIEILGSKLYPPPPGVDPNDSEAMKAAFAGYPVGAKLFVLLAWAVGTFTGGAFVGWIGKISPTVTFFSLGTLFIRAAAGKPLTDGGVKVTALALGTLFLAAGIYNMIVTPSPLWFWVVGVALFLPSAYLGATLAASARQRKSA